MKSVLVLMSTYNGEKYVSQQIESVLSQSGVEVKILVRDDGSTDSTVSLIKGFNRGNQIEIIEDRNIGYAKSFMTLVHMAAERCADYYTFCDQDDYWEPEKLLIAINSIESNYDKPALYLSQAKIVDSDLKPIKTAFHKRIIDLGPVLEHNFAIGCTMVFNEKLRCLLDINLDNMNLVAGHDSWVFVVALAVNAYVYFDTNGYVQYRQHGNNASGKIVSFKQAWKAVKKILFKWKNMRSDTAQKVLLGYDKYLEENNRKLLVEASLKHRTLREKIAFMSNQRMHSDYTMVDCLFKIAVFFDLF